MTTIAIVKKNGFAVIAADSLTTFGNTRLTPQNDASHDKILKCGDSHIGICGSAAHHLVLESVLTKTPDLKLNSKAEIFETFRRLHPVLKDEHFLNPKEDDDDPYESSQITALIANPTGIYAIYSMREVFEYTKFWAIGSGHEFALGAMHQAYQRFDNPVDIARAGIEAGAEFDKNSALPMTLYTVKLREETEIQWKLFQTSIGELQHA
ncbi:MAG: MFS transporter [Betaproteobacteria bacterium]|nr:MFS transporter [Betaproteobacteria bacterium]